jgi:Tfp pilus assembly protein PilF
MEGGQMKRYEEAEKRYLLALEADPNNTTAHNDYGNVLQQMRRYEEAEKQYLLALEADSNYAAAHNN